MARLISILILWTCFSGHFCFSQPKEVSEVKIPLFDALGPGNNQFKPTYDIIDESDTKNEGNVTNRSAEFNSRVHCAYKEEDDYTDGHRFEIKRRNSNDRCEYNFTPVTKKLGEIIKDNYGIKSSRLDEWTIQFNFLLKDNSKVRFNIYEHGKTNRPWWIEWEQKRTKTTLSNGFEKEPWGYLNNENDLNGNKVYNYEPGPVCIALHYENDHLVIYKVGGRKPPVYFTQLGPIKIDSNTKFGFDVMSNSDFYIEDFYFHSNEIRFTEKTIPNNEHSGDIYKRNENKVTFLSVANNYTREGCALGGIPIKESIKLKKMYLERGFHTLKSIHEFSSKENLKKRLDSLKEEIINENTNILYVHYGGHGANVSGDNTRLGGNPHVMIPLGFSDLFEEYGENGDDKLFNYVPKTSWFIGQLQQILSECGDPNEYKLLYVTIDACRNYINTEKRASTLSYQIKGIRKIARIDNSKVYVVIRHSVPDGKMASNNNSYTDKFLKHMKPCDPNKFINGDLEAINRVIEHKEYKDTFFGPDGQELGSSVDVILRKFSLNTKFTDHIEKNLYGN